MGATALAEVPLHPFRRALEFAALGAGIVLVITLLAARPDWRVDLGRFQALYAVAFALFAVAAARVTRYERLPGVEWMMLAVALAARLALLFVPPSLSDDLYRYLWEGRVLLHGLNPWTLAPADPALAGLRDEIIYPHINHPELSAIYPPFGVAGYALVAALEPSVQAAKLWVLAHEAVLIVTLMAWLRRTGHAPVRAMVYAWCPLAMVEYAGSGHNDPTAMVWLGVAVLTASSRPALSAASLVVGVMVKLVPLVALPFLWREWSWRARTLALAGLGFGLGGYAMLTRSADSGLSAYWQRWRNNDALFGLIERLTGSFDVARWLGLAAVVAVAVWMWRRRETAGRAIQWTLRTLLLTGPVVHPWYLGWNLMFEPVRRSAPWLLLSGLAVLNYGVLNTPSEGAAFHPPLTLRAVEYGLPFVLALSLALWRHVRSRWS